MMNRRLRQQMFWEQTKALQGRMELVSGRPQAAPRRRRFLDRLTGLRRRRA